jgi:hypothetical protein
MVYRETDAEFDDGGTPMWRRRQAERARVIDVTPPGASFRYRLRRMKLRHIIILALFFGLVVPWVVLFGGIALMTLLGINPG